MVLNEDHDGILKASEYTAEHLREVQEKYYDEGMRLQLVLGYDTYEDPCGILSGNPEIHGEGKAWIVQS
jgi:hypothetical protein